MSATLLSEMPMQLRSRTHGGVHSPVRTPSVQYSHSAPTRPHRQDQKVLEHYEEIQEEYDEILANISSSSSTSTSSQNSSKARNANVGWKEEVLRAAAGSEDTLTQQFYEFIEFAKSMLNNREKMTKLAIVFVVIVVLPSLFSLWSTRFSSHADADAAFKVEALQLLKKNYPVIANDNGRRHILRSVINSWLTRSTTPVVLIVCGYESEAFVYDFSRLFSAYAYGQNRAWSSPPIIELFYGTKRESLQTELLTNLRNIQSERDLAVIGLQRIDQLQWDAPLVLHTFADESAPPVERLLLLLSVKREFSSKECGHALETYLTDVWIQSGGNKDNVPPVLSRITSHVICW